LLLGFTATCWSSGLLGFTEASGFLGVSTLGEGGGVGCARLRTRSTRPEMGGVERLLMATAGGRPLRETAGRDC
jgi:hypothetical protein